jgi:hypothetical protein
MAYTIKNLSCFAGDMESANAKMWKYVVPSGDTVTTAGYFPVSSGLLAGDIVVAISTALTFLVISESGGVLTATAIEFASANIPS